MIEEIKARTQEFCNAHGLRYDYFENGWFMVGQAAFRLQDVESLDELADILDQCNQEHKEIEQIKWEPGLLYQALHKIDDDPTKTAIEDELARVLNQEALDKIARVFYKYSHD